MDYNLEEIQEIYQREDNITKTAQEYCKKHSLEYNDSVRRKFSKFINKNGIKDVEITTETETNLYQNDKEKTFDTEGFSMPSAWSSELNRFYSIEEYCNKFNLSYDSLEKYNLVAHNAGHMIFNVRFKQTLKEVSGIDEEFIENVVKNHIKPVNTEIPLEGEDDFFDRCVMTDIHINMHPGGEINTVPMYDHKWGREEIFDRLDRTIEHIINYKKGNVLYIDELGDLMDGLQAKTTRGGHDLPQNVSDKEAFRIGVDFKMYLIDKLVNIYDKLILNNVTNDNHSFLFGYFVNQAVKNIVDIKYPEKVEYNVLEKFMNHYTVGNHTFVETHGKDSGEKKFGIKASYDPKSAKFIDEYCKANNLYNGSFIEFSMGDQHQRIFDTTSSNDFAYHAYGAFSPPSNWVGTNFKDTPSSIDMFNIHREKNLKINIPLIF